MISIQIQLGSRIAGPTGFLIQLSEISIIILPDCSWPGLRHGFQSVGERRYVQTLLLLTFWVGIHITQIRIFFVNLRCFYGIVIHKKLGTL